LKGNIPLPRRDYAKEQPVNDAVFEAYRSQYLYDAKNLNAVVERKSDSEHARIEKITFDAAYGGERVPAYLLLPKSGTPPYQTVVFFPGAFGFFIRTPSDVDIPDAAFLDFLLTSGRAVMIPIYKDNYERNKGEISSGYAKEGRVYRNHMIWWVQDFMRSVDYLATRKEVDLTKLAFMGSSWGAQMGTIIPAVDSRVRTVVLVMGGLPMQHALPEVDPINFVKHIKVPVLLMGGQYDYVFPMEVSQRPLFNLLGSPSADKKHATFEGVGHDIPVAKRNEMIRLTLDWLDKYLGPVR
jgi:dienelactone hydrolase